MEILEQLHQFYHPRMIINIQKYELLTPLTERETLSFLTISILDEIQFDSQKVFFVLTRNIHIFPNQFYQSMLHEIFKMFELNL